MLSADGAAMRLSLILFDTNRITVRLCAIPEWRRPPRACLGMHAHRWTPNMNNRAGAAKVKCDRMLLAVRRWRLLSGGPVVTMPLVSAAPASPDTELLENCAAYARLQRELDVFDFDHSVGIPASPAVEAARTCIIATQWGHLERICAEPPSTPAGFAAVAATLALVDPEIAVADPAGGFLTDRLMAALLCGLTGVARVPQHADGQGA